MQKDEEIIQLIRNGKNKPAFEKIYRHFPSIKKFILTHGGTEDEAKDVFQESVIVFYEKASKPDFVLSSAISTFLYSISERLWFKKIRDVKSHEAALDTSFDITDNEEIRVNDEQNAKTIDQLLEHLGNPCKTLLTNYYYLKMSMKEIAQSMSYSSENIAKNQKYKCLERAKKMVKEKLFFLVTN
jgi:RNA polymerase sigma factor (sigma-70 family)